MNAPENEKIWAALKKVKVPDSNHDVVSAGMIGGLVCRGGAVSFVVEIDPAQAAGGEALRLACERAVAELPGITTAQAILTAERRTPDAAAPPQPGPPASGPGKSAAPTINRAPLPGVGAVIAVASAKGGVGKSTTAINLAVALVKLGYRVGLMDADVFGPSVPRMLGISGKPEVTADKRLRPKRAFGIKVMSIGLLVADDDTPAIWRGPMVTNAIDQMLHRVAWNDPGNEPGNDPGNDPDDDGAIDVLLVDMPPGTGDAQLTMAQRAPLTGAVIVTTPQDIALLDARKGLMMFRRVDVPVFGIIENMSYFACPHCGERTEIFDHGGGARTAAELGCDFLGEVPLAVDIRECADAGRPIVASDPGNPHAKAYFAIAQKIAKKIDAAIKSRKAG
jgi:ATP-binding protein involved in chromosome partitioning